MKPKTLAMAVPTMILITIGFGALFVYIEGKKYEAMMYKAELEKLQETIDGRPALAHIVNSIALRSLKHTTYSTLANSETLNAMTREEIDTVVKSIKQDDGSYLHNLSQEEIDAIKALLTL